jgi:hypothetical protein
VIEERCRQDGERESEQKRERIKKGEDRVVQWEGGLEGSWEE